MTSPTSSSRCHSTTLGLLPATPFIEASRTTGADHCGAESTDDPAHTHCSGDGRYPGAEPRGWRAWRPGAWAGSGSACRVVGLGAWQRLEAAAASGQHRELVDTAIAAGIRLIDTSPMYGDAERLLADAA